ncbi:TetR/AcrR family transcriptional regulator [Dyella solisilvae]|nr:TetR/AcrR family transcriptional regulator [Dyella solisilvae]
MTRKSLAPRQARSRESEQKLLKAAMEVLGRYGLDATTIPRIAEHAGLTPGAVYRRFPDKNALLETVILTILENQDVHIRRVLTPAMTREHTLPELIEQIISATLASYRANSGLLMGLRQFVQGSDHLAFKNKAVKLEKQSYTYVLDVLLAYRDDIPHPDPSLALSFAFATLTGTLIEFFLIDENMKNWRALIPDDDKVLLRELKRSFLGYLMYQPQEA